MWYGSHSLSPFYRLRNSFGQRKLNLTTRTSCVVLTRNVNFHLQEIIINVTLPLKAIVFRNALTPHAAFQIVIISQFNFSVMAVPHHFCDVFASDPSTIVFGAKTIHNHFHLYWNLLQTLVRISMENFLFKIKFRGKGYYIYKNSRNTIAFKFGFGHRVYRYGPFLNLRKMSSTSILLSGCNIMDAVKLANSIRELRPYNMYTGKGVRFSRQAIYRKIGKVGSYC